MPRILIRIILGQSSTNLSLEEEVNFDPQESSGDIEGRSCVYKNERSLSYYMNFIDYLLVSELEPELRDILEQEREGEFL